MKPTAIKILEGNRGKRNLDNAEPSYKALSSTPPDWLDCAALAEWKRLEPLLRANALLTEADYAAFSLYCQAYSDYQRLTKLIREEGETVPDKFGSMKKHPALSAKAQAYSTLVEMLKQFGFSPNARQRISSSATNDTPSDELEGTDWF